MRLWWYIWSANFRSKKRVQQKKRKKILINVCLTGVQKDTLSYLLNAFLSSEACEQAILKNLLPATTTDMKPVQLSADNDVASKE